MLRRVEAQSKRLAEALFTFAYLELAQRYELPQNNVITEGIGETILRSKPLIKERFQTSHTVEHLIRYIKQT